MSYSFIVETDYCKWILHIAHTDFQGKCLLTGFKSLGRVFVSGPGYLGSIPGRVIPKTFKMVLDNTQ